MEVYIWVFHILNGAASTGDLTKLILAIKIVSVVIFVRIPVEAASFKI